ncbi:hypothetical protein [Paraburkholderia nemoris]|uniref:hypothetical protein n=1 Tax=Paraburkholderia nemoris TaxID=2793076 RepID=UPI001B16E6B2|nr:hypothetical protein [Paraburkholderia nemoris]CAE6851311.1 hypothetical protein R75777_07558 [Paraburkholderia nemoris]
MFTTAGRGRWARGIDKKRAVIFNDETRETLYTLVIFHREARISFLRGEDEAHEVESFPLKTLFLALCLECETAMVVGWR